MFCNSQMVLANENDSRLPLRIAFVDGKIIKGVFDFSFYSASRASQDCLFIFVLCEANTCCVINIMIGWNCDFVMRAIYLVMEKCILSHEYANK